MASRLQLRKGTTAQHATFTGALAEVTVDTTKKVVVVHDNATVGGIPMATESSVTNGLSNKVDKNANITAGTATKVTYDAKGLVTAGTTLTATDIPALDTSKLTTGTLGVARGGTGVATITGLVKGNGASAMTAAVAGTDYVAPSGSITGNAGTATKLATVRSLAISGDITWTVNFDGSANVTAVGTLANSGVTAGTYTKVTVDAKGRTTVGANLAASDIPALDASKITSGIIDAARLPAYVDDVLEFTNLASFPATGTSGKIYVALDTNKTYRWSGSVYVYITSGAVDSVNGMTGVVVLSKSDIGLVNVDNTTDLLKPISTATQTALDLKVDKVTGKGLSTEDYTTAEKSKLSTLVNYIHPTNGVTPGTYKSVTVDAYGHVYGGTNPTTVSGYGITDAYTKTQVDTSLAGKAGLSTNNTFTGTTKYSANVVNGAGVSAGRAIVLPTATTIGPNEIDLNAGTVFTKTVSGTTLTIATSQILLNTDTTGQVASFLLELTTSQAVTISTGTAIITAGGADYITTAGGKDIFGCYSYDQGVTWTLLQIAKDVK